LAVRFSSLSAISGIGSLAQPLFHHIDVNALLGLAQSAIGAFDVEVGLRRRKRHRLYVPLFGIGERGGQALEMMFSTTSWRMPAMVSLTSRKHP
jgi:hypothetical protein